jgi:hypothetical protein
MKLILKTLALALLIAGAASTHSAFAQQQHLICNTSTGAFCNIHTNPGDGTQGQPAWLFNGVSEVNFDQIFTMLGPTGTLPTPLYGVQFNNNGTLGSLIPPSTGTWCLDWTNLSAAPALINCGGGSGTVTSIGVTTPGWLTVSPSSINTSGTFAITGTVESNNLVLASAPTGTNTGLAPRALVAADIPTIPTTGLSGTLQAAQEPAHTGDATNTAGSLALTVGKVNGLPIPPSAALVGTNSSSQFVSVTTPLALSLGGTGTASPGLIAGSNISVTGSWPNQTVNASVPSSAFSALTTGTNAQASMVVGTGSSLSASGSGSINATNTVDINGAAVPASALVLGSNSIGQLIFETTTGTGFPVLSNSPTLVTPALGAATATSINGTAIPASATLLVSGGALGTPSSAVLTNATGLPNASVIGLGTFATANAASPPAIGGTTPAAGTFLSLKDTGVTGAVQCLHADSTGAISGTGADCGTGSGSGAFGTLTGGTNNGAAMVVGTGASLAASGSGTIAATSMPTTGLTGALQAAQEPAHTGDVTNTAGSLATTVKGINGTILSGLGTGILKNTTATGAPSIAVAADFPTLNQNTTGNAGTATAFASTPTQCTGGTFSTGITTGGNSNCGTPAGGGNVSNSGTPTIHQTGVWQSATTISGVGPGTIGQAFASTGATTDPAYTSSLSGVTSVNGSSVPASTTLAGLTIAETYSALKTFGNSDIAMLGSSTGTTTLTSANASASNFTITIPAITDTLATLTATQTLSNKTMVAPALGTPTALVLTNATGLPNASVIGLGTFATANAATPPAIGGTTPAAGTFSSLKDTGVTGLTQCLHVDTTGAVTGTGSDCGSGGSTAFSGLTSGTNTAMAGVVGTGASLATSGTGTIAATNTTGVNGAAVPASAAVLASNASNQLVAATTTGTGSAVLATSPTLVTPTLGAASASGLTLSAITGSTQCLQVNTSGVVAGSGAGCAGAPAFSSITTGTNTTATMTVGTGGSITTSGTGSITATAAPVTGISGLGTGVATFLATPSSANLAAAVTGETGTGAVVFATSPTLVTPALGTPASGVLTNATGLPLTTGVTGNLPLANMATIATQTVLGNGSGSTGVPVALALSGNLVATATGLGTSQAINAQTGTTYTLLTTDAGKLLTISNAAAVAISLPVATTTGFTAGFAFDIQNKGAGTATITPTTSTINGSATLALATNQGCTVTSDGTNYQVSACTAVGGGGGGSGTITSSTSGQIPVYTAATTVAGSANATLTAGALTLGVSGTAGSVKMGNATSGTVQLQPVTGALGAVTASLPANTGTVAELNLAQTWSATQTITTGGSVTPGGTGVVNANQVNGAAPSTSSAVAATNSSGQIIAATTTTFLIDAGTTFTLGTGTGACATTTTLTGGTSAGKFTCTGTAGASTQPIVLPTAPHGWACYASDVTSGVSWAQSATSTTGCTVKGAIATTSDVVVFAAVGY